MSRDVLDQLRVYGGDFDAALTPLTLEDVVDEGTGKEPARPVGAYRQVRSALAARPRWVVAAAGAVVVLVALAPLLLFAGGTKPNVGAPGLDVETVSPTTVLQATTPPEAAGWSRVPHDAAVFGGVGDAQPWMNSVSAGGPGLVAVGRAGSGLDHGAAVWTSVDGLTWSRVPHDEAVFGGEGAQWMNSVTVGGPGLVAVGFDGLIGVEYGWTPMFSGVAAVWTSVDGLTWSRVPHDEEVFGGEDIQMMNSVTAGGPGLVTVGYDGRDAPYVSPDQDAAVWTSVDGLTWSRVPHDEAVFGGEGPLWMNSVTAGGPGLVAVGLASDGNWPADDADAAVWTSVDGITWLRVPHDEEIFGDDLGLDGLELQRMNSVTAAGPGLVAVGFAPTPNQGPAFTTDAAVWASVDGITWSRVPHDEAIFGGVGDHEMFDVAVGGPGVVAVGRAGRGSNQGAAVWTSVDGLTWSRVPHDRAVFGGVDHQVMWSVTARGPRLVAVGSIGLDVEAESAAVWMTATED